MNVTQKGGVKEIIEVSPEAENRCIFCVELIENEEIRIRLWHGDKKSKACKEIEQCLGEKIKSWDLKIICKNCLRKVRRVLLKVNDKRTALKKGREKSSLYLSKRTKRLADAEQSSEESKRAKQTEDGQPKIKEKVKI